MPCRSGSSSVAAGGWAERLVDHAEGEEGFRFCLGPASPLHAHLLPEPLRDEPEGAVVEVSPASLAIASDIGRRFAKHGGAALIIDYGHERPKSGVTSAGSSSPPPRKMCCKTPAVPT